MEELMEIARNKIKEKNFYGDIYIENVIKTEVIINNSKVEKLTKSNTICGNIRVFKNGKMGFCYFSGKGRNILDNAFTKAINSTFIEGYENYFFNSGSKAEKNLKIFDDSYKNLNDENRINTAIFLEKFTKENPDIKIVRDTNYTDSIEKIFYINSENQQNYSEKTKFFVSTSAVAEKNGNREIAEIFDYSVLFKDLNIAESGKNCATKASNLLNGKQAKSGKYKIMLNPETACDLLSLISKIFLGNNIIKGKSLLANHKSGDIISTDILTIKDDALLDFKIGSFSIDAEGECAQNKYLIKNGVLKTFLFDKINGLLYNTKTTGNCVRTNFKFLPECDISNFYIENGKESVDKTKNNFTGIYINSFMGLHMADTVSGNFSLAFNGWIIDKGEKANAIKESLMVGNLKELLKKILIICDDLKFYANYGSPTLVIDNMEITGD